MPNNTRKNRGARKSRSRTVRRKPARLAPSTALAVKKIVKKQMGNVIESKHADFSNEPIPLSCYYHNVTYIHDSDVFTISQGVQDSEISNPQNRIGDTVYVKNVQFRLLITNFSTRPNLLYRITICKVKSGSVALPNPYTHPQCGNAIMAPIDTEDTNIISVAYDRVFSSLAYQTAQQGNADKKFYWKYNLKVNKKVRYDNASNVAANFTYRVFVTCYDTQGALITDNVARFTYFRRTHFLDA